MAKKVKYSLSKQDLDANSLSLQCLTPWDAETVDWRISSATTATLQDSWVLTAIKVARLCAIGDDVWIRMDSATPTAVADGANCFIIPQWVVEYMNVKPLQDDNGNNVLDSNWDLTRPKIACIWGRLNVTLMY